MTEQWKIRKKINNWYYYNFFKKNRIANKAHVHQIMKLEYERVCDDNESAKSNKRVPQAELTKMESTKDSTLCSIDWTAGWSGAEAMIFLMPATGGRTHQSD